MPLFLQPLHNFEPHDIDLKDLEAVSSCFLNSLANLKTVAEQGRVCTMESMDTSDPLEGGGGDILRQEYQV